MNKLEEFIQTELTDYTRLLLTNLVENDKRLGKEFTSITLNRFTLDMNYIDWTVSLIDDVFSEDDTQDISIDEFLRSIRK